MSPQHILPLLLFSSFLSSSVFADQEAYKPDKASKEVVVEGMVYCQSCTLNGTWSLAGANPLPSSKVGIACRDRKNRVSFHKSFRTDHNGYFFAPVHPKSGIKNFFNGDPISACTVRLLSSSNTSCNLLTNINYGIEGSPLLSTNKTVGEAALYSAAPLAFRPNNCSPVIVY